VRYLKLYEEFKIIQDEEVDTLEKPEVSNKTIEDVLKDDFFDDIEDKELEDDSKEYSSEVINIKNWKVY
jgi:hypothetical protein